jgi:hypothetical protein
MDNGAAVRVMDLQATTASDSIGVTGAASFPGEVMHDGTDPVGDGAIPSPVDATALGLDIIGARAVARPEREDLYFEVEHAPRYCGPLGEPPLGGCEKPPHTGVLSQGHSGMNYNLAFTTGGVDYRVEASCIEFCYRLPVPWRVPVTGPNPAIPDHMPIASPTMARFTLFECAPVCTPVGDLAGGFGMIGDKVTVSVPFSAINASVEDAIGPVHISTEIASDVGGLIAVDDMELGAFTPRPRVMLGMAPTGTSLDAIDFTTAATLTNGSFTGTVPIDGYPAGDYDVWAKACIGSVCADPTKISVTVGGAS